MQTLLPGETWAEYSRLVLRELERLSDRIDAMAGEVQKIREDDMTALKIQIAGLHGNVYLISAVSGLLGGLVPFVLHFLK